MELKKEIELIDKFEKCNEAMKELLEYVKDLTDADSNKENMMAFAIYSQLTVINICNRATFDMIIDMMLHAKKAEIEKEARSAEKEKKSQPKNTELS